MSLMGSITYSCTHIKTCDKGVWQGIPQINRRVPCHVNRNVCFHPIIIGYILGCTRPPQSQSGAIFCCLNNHCILFKIARQFWGKNHRKMWKIRFRSCIWNLAGKYVGLHMTVFKINQSAKNFRKWFFRNWLFF